MTNKPKTMIEKLSEQVSELALILNEDLRYRDREHLVDRVDDLITELKGTPDEDLPSAKQLTFSLNILQKQLEQGRTPDLQPLYDVMGCWREDGCDKSGSLEYDIGCGNIMLALGCARDMVDDIRGY